MSLEQAILEHAAAIRELASAVLVSAKQSADSTIRLAQGYEHAVDASKPVFADKPKADKPAPETKKAEEKKALAADEDKALDYDKDVAPALTGYMKANGRQAGIDLMAKFGAKKGSEIKPEDYAAVLADINTVE